MVPAVRGVGRRAARGGVPPARVVPCVLQHEPPHAGGAGRRRAHVALHHGTRQRCASLCRLHCNMQARVLVGCSCAEHIALVRLSSCVHRCSTCRVVPQGVVRGQRGPAVCLQTTSGECRSRHGRTLSRKIRLEGPPHPHVGPCFIGFCRLRRVFWIVRQDWAPLWGLAFRCIAACCIAVRKEQSTLQHLPSGRI